jgi:hypothetical protein
MCLRLARVQVRAARGLAPEALAREQAVLGPVPEALALAQERVGRGLVPVVLEQARAVLVPGWQAGQLVQETQLGRARGLR